MPEKELYRRSSVAKLEVNASKNRWERVIPCMLVTLFLLFHYTYTIGMYRNI